MLTKDDFNAADFYSNAVFSGDSVLSHFYWMVPYYDKETFGGSKFLVAASYSLREALWADSKLHPMYQGESRQIWKSMELIQPERVFLFFGLNDIAITGVEGHINNYKKTIGYIKEAVPGVKIYIISITPMRADSEGKYLNNTSIDNTNLALQELCAENGYGYIDVATMLKDETGALNLEYSDGTNVHLVKSAYLLWKEVLVDYAKEQLLLEYYEANVETE